MFRIDRHSRLPYPTQVQRQALAQFVAGRLQRGDRLPSVRHLAKDLHISRTTAERVHEALCEALPAEVRPRSGAYVALSEPIESETGTGLEWAHAVYAFLDEILQRGHDLGLAPSRLAQLICAFERDEHEGSTSDRVHIPLLATPDAFECMVQCLPRDFPVQLVHISPTARAIQRIRRTRYLLCGYYLREQGRRLADALGLKLLYVRYNVKVLDESMAIGGGEHRHFLTRDRDNAETTRVFLASAYPEVPTNQYTVAAAADWLQNPAVMNRPGQIWVTITARPMLCGRVDPSRMRPFHPILSEDFIEELRCLALIA